MRFQFVAIDPSNVDRLADGLCDLEITEHRQQEISAYWRHRLVSSPAGPGASVAALCGDQVIGKLDGIAVPVQVGREIHRAAVLAGLSVNPEFRNWETYRGLLDLSLRQGMEQGLRFGIAFSNRRAAALNRDLGLTVLGRLPVLAAILDWGEALRGLNCPQWLAGLARAVPRPGKFRLLPPSPNTASADEISRFDRDGFAALWEEVAPWRPVSIIKDAAYLNWRYAECPGKDYRCLAVVDQGVPQGYLVYRHLQRRREIAILELEAGASNPDRVFSSLWSRFCEDIRGSRAGLIRASFSPASPAFSYLTGIGFGAWPTRISNIHLVAAVETSLARSPDFTLPKWCLSLGDWLYY